MEQQKILMMIPDINSDELYTLQSMMQGMNEIQENQFISLYKGRRKDKQLMLVFTILGFFGVAGIQRLVVGDVLMGVLYFFTAGLCFIGTIMDLININSITLKYNTAQAAEAANMVRMMYRAPQ